jgi:tRNA G18 (ribose-2'-O)-methylase SpoU
MNDPENWATMPTITPYNNNFNVRDDLKSLTVDEIKAARKHKNFAVATFNLKGDLNLGSIMRTAEITGAKDFFILGHRSWDRRSAVGVQNYLNVEKHEECVDWKTTEELMNSRGYRPMVVEQGGMDFLSWVNHFDTLGINRDWYKPCFIFGPEDIGLPDWTAHLSLEQIGVSRSYNVSSAASVILYNWSFGK